LYKRNGWNRGVEKAARPKVLLMYRLLYDAELAQAMKMPMVFFC